MTSAELPCSLASPSAPRLPVELLAQIADEAAGPPVKLDYATLRHLCLTSKSILPFARSALYRDISATFYDARDESAEDQTPHVTLEWFDACLVCYDGRELEISLADSPHLANLVKSIAFHFALRYMEAKKAPAVVLQRLLEACPLVDTIRLLQNALREEVAALSRVLQTSLPSIVELVAPPTQDIFNLLHHLKDL
ncbi:hypothetical protein BCR35DRAFT_101255 [Leucosporidium creatinivorum]|uniref:F-box domain-containing protein n=1 Tax=Leucosporidium creatinivorum TaxID=106004 RepID=A0A1Y2F3C2_9BASI|nr:hypothetical protein BCR35DRAFT_101255 [Leucosporidium creatinivorum]